MNLDTRSIYSKMVGRWSPDVDGPWNDFTAIVNDTEPKNLRVLFLSGSFLVVYANKTYKNMHYELPGVTPVKRNIVSWSNFRKYHIF